MASPRKPNRPEAWLLKREMAAVLDVRTSYFDRAIRPKISEEHIRRDGRALRFYARGVLDTWYGSKNAESPVGSDEETTSEYFGLYLQAFEDCDL